MAPSSDLPQTLRLLDCADALRQTEEAHREHLVTHLQSVCENLGHPLPEHLARQAVTEELGQAPLPVLAQGGPLDRPASHEAWVTQRKTLKERLAVLHPLLRRYKRRANAGLGFYVAFAGPGFFCLIVFLALLGAHPPMDHEQALSLMKVRQIMGWASLVTLTGMISSLVISTLLRPNEEAYQEEEKQATGQLEALTALELNERPTLETMATWCRAPGVSAACHQILASPVPFLRGDVRELRRRYQAHKAAMEQVEKTQQAAIETTTNSHARAVAHWDQGLRTLLQGDFAT